jgi:mRNA interferase YafQ
MSYTFTYTKSFSRDVKLMSKRKYNMKELTDLLEQLRDGNPLPEKYHDHQLKGSMKQFREWHIAPDWLLLYLKDRKNLILTLVRTGSHADLLNK